MAKMKSKTKKTLKIVGLALAGVVALGLLSFGIKAIVDYTKNDLKKITLSYDVGNLGADGKYVNDESTLYTKEAFGCYGLQVKPDFDSTVNYQIFYYDILDNYISSTSLMSDGYSGEAPVNGAYARIVIEPKDDEDGKISFTERIKYPSQLTVKVKKNQDINNRFTVFKSRIMQIVSDTDSLVFTSNFSFDDKLCDFVESHEFNCATTTTLLKVNGGLTITFDKTVLSEYKSENAFCRIYQFKDLPSNENMIISSSYSVDTSVVLDKKAQYIIIVADQHGDGEAWTETEISKLPSCFSITKTK